MTNPKQTESHHEVKSFCRQRPHWLWRHHVLLLDLRILLCEKPFAGWPFDPAEYDCVTARSDYKTTVCVLYVRTHTCCYMFNRFYACVHACTNVLRGLIHACLNVSPSALKSGHIPHIIRRLVLLVSPQRDLTTSWGVNSARQVFGVHSSNVASILSAWASKQKVSLLVCKSVIVTEHFIWFWNWKSLEICSRVKTREVFKPGKTPKDRQTFLTEKIRCRAKMKKAAQEQDAGNLLNSFDSSFNRPWQDFNNLPNKSWPQWGWKIAARAVRRFHLSVFHNCISWQGSKFVRASVVKVRTTSSAAHLPDLSSVVIAFPKNSFHLRLFTLSAVPDLD